MTTEAFVFDAIRTPRGRGKQDGALHAVPAIDLAATLSRALQERNGLETSLVDDVVLGCVTPIGEQGGNIARTAALYAGWNLDVPGMQINRFCASGLETVNNAAMKVRSGWEHLVVAGGVESMSRVAMGTDGGAMYEDPRVSAAIGFVPQGIGADLIATIEGFTAPTWTNTRRNHSAVQPWPETLAASPRSCRYATETGRVLLAHDEHIRDNTTVEGLGTLKPAFARIGAAQFDAVALEKYPDVGYIEHVHTAGNSSGIVDGAALVLVGSAAAGAAIGKMPRARVVAAALVGTEPTIMLTGPGPATQKALQLAGMNIADIDLIEVNEAFAAVVLRFLRDVGLDSTEKVNVNGGAIALGHPLGATGAVLLGTALDELERRDLNTALITLCVGGGMGIATIIERV